MTLSNDRLTRRLTSLIDWMMRLEGWTAILLLVVLFLTMAAQVVARYVFHSPFSWSEELARLAMIWMSFVAASLVMARQGHITVDLWDSRIGRRMPKRFFFLLDCLVQLLVSATCLVLLVGGMRFVWYVHPVGSPALGIPKSLWYAAVSVGLGLMAVHSLLHLILLLRVGHVAKSVGGDKEFSS